MYTKQQRITMIIEARELMREAMELLTDAVDGTDADGTFNAYTVPTVEKLIESDHNWAGRNSGNLHNLIDIIKDEKEPAPTSNTVMLSETDNPNFIEDDDYIPYTPAVEELPGALKDFNEWYPSRIDFVKRLRQGYGFRLNTALDYTRAIRPVN